MKTQVSSAMAGFIAAVLASTSLGCKRAENGAPEAGAPASSSRASAPDARVAAIRSAELRRASADITEADLSSRNVVVRRGAARALARIADDRAVELLSKSIADEDVEVVTWSAYGLGYACSGRERHTVPRLAARSASLLAWNVEQKPEAPAAKALSAIAGAFGRCGNTEAEKTLRAWLGAELPLAESAALGLGRLAVRHARLDDASLVALLDAARRKPNAPPSALASFSRLSALGEPVRERLIDVAKSLVAERGLARAHAVRALPQAGEVAAGELERVLVSGEFSSAERADAARGLGRVGRPGQASLARGIEALLGESGPLGKAGLLSPEFGVLSAALEAIALPVDQVAPSLGRLAELPVQSGSDTLRRRSIALRCRAAELLAGRGTLSPRLAACDPDPKGRLGQLARLSVLDRGPLKGARQRRFLELAAGDDALVRVRALELLKGHPELDGAAALIARALASKSPGEVATAAEVITQHPSRASARTATAEPASTPDPAVVKALTTALETWERSPLVEVRAAVGEAAAALDLLGAKPALERDCASPNPTLRKRAERALRRLAGRDRNCAPVAAKEAPAELSHLLTRTARLELDTDAGPLFIELDPSTAPAAATRLAELAASGFFDGIVVHRVVPGFVVQFGDPGADGYGGADKPPLPCETAPLPFDPGSVGIALGGRDTGSSQLFVTLARHPHLDGEYPLVGRAGPGFELLAQGDVIKKARVSAR